MVLLVITLLAWIGWASSDPIQKATIFDLRRYPKIGNYTLLLLTVSKSACKVGLSKRGVLARRAKFKDSNPPVNPASESDFEES